MPLLTSSLFFSGTATPRKDPSTERQTFSTGTVLIARPHQSAPSVPTCLKSCGDFPHVPLTSALFFSGTMSLQRTVRIDPRLEPQSFSTGTVLLACPHCSASSFPARLGSCGDLLFFPDDPSAAAAGTLQLQCAFVQGLQASVVADRRRGDAELAALVVESHLRVDV
uniref:Uncharacterized protein n=1 Tax=Ixodes ricinus TaxID=34613 RepID=A0A147BPS0_IXORI